MKLLRARPLTAFFLIAFSITWGFAGVFWALVLGETVDTGAASADGSSQIQGAGYDWWTRGLSYLGVWAPSLSGFFMAWVCDGRRGAWDLLSRLWRRPLARWTLLAALLLPAALEGLAALAGWLATDYPTGGFGPKSAGSAVLFVLVALFSGPLGEEFGWRGFALPRMVERMGAKAAAIILSLIWALWHAPVFIVPNLQSLAFPAGMSFWAVAAMILGGGVVIAWLTMRSGGALGPAVVFHTTMLCALLFVRQDPNETVMVAAAALYVLVGWTLLFWTRDLGRAEPARPRHDARRRPGRP